MNVYKEPSPPSVSIDDNLKNLNIQMRKMQGEINFLKSLICKLDDTEKCKCEKCWSDRKYKELGGEEYMLDWQMRKLNHDVKQAWIAEQKRRYEWYIDNV